MKRHRGAPLWLIGLFVGAASPAFAQFEGFDFVPMGSGARALGMGGAFIAIADDATASFWNPAGLTQLERPEVSVVGQYRSRRAEVDFLPPVFVEEHDTGTIDRFSLSFVSATLPVKPLTKLAGRRVVASLHYGTLFDFDVEFAGASAAGVFSDEQRGLVGGAGLSFGVELGPTFSIGFGGFYAFGDVEFKQILRFSDLFGIPETDITEITDEFSGVGFLAGALYRPSSKLSFGLVVRSPIFLRDVIHSRFDVIDPATDTVTFSTGTERSDESFNYPFSIGVGAAYRPVELLTFALDIVYLNTGSLNLPTDFPPTPNADIWQGRFGIEYLIQVGKIIIPVRTGAFYNPAPIKDVNDHQIPGYTVTAGAGIVFQDFQIDAAYNFTNRLKRDVGAFLGETAETIVPGVILQQQDHRALLSAIYRF
ncbi:MAG: hypothetical protein HY347_04135 [candidate division NC10 bacterium]|nr:hypothetical protein [candidate division NC10 bacterium]